MRFTLGTLVGVALGIVAAPIAANTPGLGPAVTDAQAQTWKLLRARMAVSSSPDELRPEAPPQAGPEARSESRRARAARANRSNSPSRHAGIVSLAAIAAAQPEAGDAESTRTPISSTDNTPDAGASAAITYSGHGDARAHDAPANLHANTGPEIDNDVDIRTETETRTEIGNRAFDDDGGENPDAALDQQVGVLDRLFATYDRVDEE